MVADLSSTSAEGPTRPTYVGGWQAHPINNGFWTALGRKHDQLALALLLERTRWFMWLPVGLGFGIAWYFALSFEPDARMVAGSVAAACVLLWLAVFPVGHLKLLGFRFLIIAGLLIAVGFALSAHRNTQVQAPVIPWSGVFSFNGTVTLVEPRRNGARVTIERLDFERLDRNETPKSVRLTVRNDATSINAGDRVRVRGRLQPPSGRLVPNGFDFARQAYFKGLGGIGYAFGKAEILEKAQSHGMDLWFAHWRQAIAVRAGLANEGSAGPVSAALLTGLRAGIPADVWLNMQASGLAHLLAISGLHMGLIAGTIYLIAKLGLSSIRGLALRIPAKRLAAAIAMAGALFYLGLAGAPVPTQRAFLMTGIVFLAIMIDRNPISMRLVACAALVILLIRPESLPGVSFQMSFAAVIGLVAFYEAVGRWFFAANYGQRTILRVVGFYILGIAATSIIATLATAPFAAFHFNKLPTYGILANVIAVPLTAFWVMPMGLIGVLLIPFGWDQPFLYAMGLGVKLILATADGVASLPASLVHLPTLPDAVLILGVLGGLWLCIWQEIWRFWGLLPLAVAAIMLVSAKPADILIAPDLGIIAAYQPGDAAADDIAADSPVAIHRWRRDSFRERAFLSAMGTGQSRPFPPAGTGIDNKLACDPGGCRLEQNGLHASILIGSSGIFEDCKASDLVIAPNGPAACPNGRQLIDFYQLRASGGLALFATKQGWKANPVYSSNVDRPWTPRFAKQLKVEIN